MTSVANTMFELHHAQESIGRSRLESGDPAERTVSGVFFNVGGAKALAGWIKSIGGSEDEGAVYVALNEDFALLDSEGQPVYYAEGTLISVPGEDETFVEFSGIREGDYEKHFSNHLAAMPDDDA